MLRFRALLPPNGYSPIQLLPHGELGIVTPLEISSRSVIPARLRAPRAVNRGISCGCRARKELLRAKVVGFRASTKFTALFAPKTIRRGIPSYSENHRETALEPSPNDRKANWSRTAGVEGPFLPCLIRCGECEFFCLFGFVKWQNWQLASVAVILGAWTLPENDSTS